MKPLFYNYELFNWITGKNPLPMFYHVTNIKPRLELAKKFEKIKLHPLLRVSRVNDPLGILNSRYPDVDKLRYLHLAGMRSYDNMIARNLQTLPFWVAELAGYTRKLIRHTRGICLYNETIIFEFEEQFQR